MRKNRKRSSGRGRRNRKQILRMRLIIGGGIVLLAVIMIFLMVRKAMDAGKTEKTEKTSEGTSQEAGLEGAPDMDVQLLTVNEYSRPGIALNQVNGVVIHYTANPGSSARANRDYFEGLKDNHTTKASSHFIVGLEGEIVQCIPTAEISYASNDRNSDTISIECCHPDETGQFNTATYDSVVNLTAWLCKRFGLTSEAVIRHYDITGKECPKYFVENADAWDTFRADVEQKLAEL
ncbi:MAG: peptidoglycan recognition family protein [Lachnospiraceae bacterium]|nr:peptidoglycan recognition family protein [Lachnospiraceae bacterium]